MSDKPSSSHTSFSKTNIVVFLLSFLFFTVIFTNWDHLKAGLFGTGF